ncbi:MAG TPA: hypothetical protein VFC92_03325 [Bacteroidales bacterium]|nr:hypothetical protein [Bacteroidales bacterium]
MTNSEISKEILKRLEEIEKQLDNIYIANNTTLDILIRCIGQNNTLHFQKDVQNKNDFKRAVYTLVGLLALNKMYSEKIDVSTKEVCTIFRNIGTTEQIIEGIYSKLAGPFFDDIDAESLYYFTCTFADTNSERFMEIYESNRYEPNGTKYLGTLWGLMNDYSRACDVVQGHLDFLRPTIEKF